jgi:hypothetical protein
VRTDEQAEPVEVRLARLAALHAAGELDEAEFRAAKAAVLAPGVAGGTGSDDAPGTPLRMRWWGWFLVTIVLGFTVACLGAVWPVLQEPSAPVVCGSDELVAGRDVANHGSETDYNIRSSCRRDDGRLDRLSQVEIIAVLWVIYTALASVVVAVAVVITRLVRRALRMATGVPSP